MTQFSDSFSRADGALGTDWSVICGDATILDNAVVPIASDGSGGFGVGISPIDLLASRRTQVFYSGSLDRQDVSVRAVFGHDENIPDGVSGDASFTLLARASKDPLLLDLGGTEEPDCYDQAYGVRFTALASATQARIDIIKLVPSERINSTRASNSQPDDAVVLKTINVQAGWLNNRVAPANPTSTTGLTYTGMWQDMRMRVYGKDGEVTIDVYLNDRFEQEPVLSTTDRAEPTWETGSVGIEFWSPTYDDQPNTASAFSEAATPVMRCSLFGVETIKAFAQPRTEDAPRTYGWVIDRVIELVEKNGESQYSATNAGIAARTGPYKEFVLEAEAHIIRTEGYWEWLHREQRIYLVADKGLYEMPTDFGELIMLRPGNFQGPVLLKASPYDFNQRLGGIQRTGGLPRIFRDKPPSVNGRPRIQVFPVPTQTNLTNSANDDQANPDNEDLHLIVEYYKKRIRPTAATIDTDVPVIPQQHLDVLIYGATAHAVLLDSSQSNTQNFAQTFQSKLAGLRRSNNRKVNERVTLKSVADIMKADVTSRLPQLRSTQLEVLLA